MIHIERISDMKIIIRKVLSAVIAADMVLASGISVFAEETEEAPQEIIVEEETDQQNEENVVSEENSRITEEPASEKEDLTEEMTDIVSKEPESSEDEQIPDKTAAEEEMPEEEYDLPVYSVYTEGIEEAGPENIIITGESVMKIAESQQLILTGDYPDEMNVRWATSDSKTATVTSTGLVSAWRKGEVTITVSFEDGNIEKTFEIEVKDRDYVPDHELKKEINGTVTDTAHSNNYTRWSDKEYAYLYENSDGSFTRLEYNRKDAVILETWKDDMVISSKTLEMELPLFGGSFSGEIYNYIVFGQSNVNETDDCEVMRVVQYDKNWNRINSASIKGCNTYYPFYAGSLRMAETGGKLYIHTCHEMYKTDDGYNHQANMTFVLSQSVLSVLDRCYNISDYSKGYVSHSFNQFILADDQNVYRIDHGDYHPRSLYVTMNPSYRVLTKVSGISPVSFPDYPLNYNITGASVGGAQMSDRNILIAGNMVDFTRENYDMLGVRDIYLWVVRKDLSDSMQMKITDLDPSGSIKALTPQLVKIGDHQFMIMWEEYNNSDDTYAFCYAPVDEEGNMPWGIIRKDLGISDCQPVLTSEGLVTWYVTDGKKVIRYTIDPFNEFNEPEYVWHDDDRSCKATIQSFVDPSYVISSDVSVLSTVITPASCEKEGEERLTASFSETVFMTQTKTKKIPASGHAYNASEWNWSSDHAAASVRLVCANDASHVQELNASVKKTTEDAQCETDGRIVYQAAAEYDGKEYSDTKEEKIPATGHDYDGPEWTWAADYSYAGAVFTCRNDKNHLFNAEGTISSAEDEDGNTVYIAHASGPDGKTYTDTITRISEENRHVIRAAGETRYQTSLKIADLYKEMLKTDKFDAVVVASGSNYPDALSGSCLAVSKHAPILLTKQSENENVKAYIRKNLKKGGMIYILGGASAVSMDMEEGLSGFEVRRLMGADRYGTNLAIMKELNITDEEMIIASGTGYADTLSASSSGRPIMLVSKKYGFNKEQKEYLESLKTGKWYIAGGTASVSEDVETYLRSRAGNIVKRFNGATRYETSVMISGEFAPGSCYAVLAYGGGYPDGLCGGTIAALKHAPVLLTKDGETGKYAVDHAEKSIRAGVVTGGPERISDELVRKIYRMRDTDRIIQY